jgi:hypothetical protein
MGAILDMGANAAPFFLLLCGILLLRASIAMLRREFTRRRVACTRNP